LNFADLWTGGAVPAFPGLPVNQTEKVAGLTAAATGFTSGVSSAFNVGKWASTVAATGGNKIYDGTTTAMVTLADHQVFGGAVGYTRASFGWQNVGNGQPVSVSGNSISGPAAGNYNFQNLIPNRTASTSASLPALAVTWSGSRAYDRPTAAAANLTLGNNFNGVNLTLPGSVPLAVNNAGSPMISAVALAPGGSATANVQGTPYTKTFNTGSSVGTIPDGNPVGVTFVGTVSGTPSGGIVGGLTVGLNISGGYNGDLYAYLVAPNGTLVVLLNQPGVTGGNSFGYGGAGLSVTLSDSASTSIQNANETGGAQFTGTYQAAGSLVSFNGSVADGTWTLYFADLSSGGGTSTLDSWSLDITAVPEPVNVALGIFGGLLGGLGLVRHHATKRRSVLAAAMFGPVQTAGDQLDGGGIHQVDHAFETEGEPQPALPAKTGVEFFQMAEDGVEEVLGHLGRAFAVGGGERVLAGRDRATHRRERSRMQTQGIADIVEADGMGELGIEQTHHMTPRRECPGAFDDPGIPRQFGHQMRRNKIAELMQEREAAARWLVRCGFIHPLPCGRFTRGKPTLFYPSTLNPVGLL
jgi:subtilisin-like proprotein convertase family protein